MSATLARQGGRVQLEQSDMRLALNLAKMARGGFSRAAIEETQFLIEKPRAEVWDETKSRVEFSGHNNLKAAIESHTAMLQESQMDGCPPCQNVTAQNPQRRWRCKRTGAPPPDWLWQLTPEPTPHSPETPLVPPGNNEAAHVSEIEGVLPGYVSMSTAPPSAQLFNLDAHAKDRKRDKDCNPDLLTDMGTSTG